MQKKNNPVVVNDAMPHDVRAEKGIIGSMLIDPDAYFNVIEILKNEEPFFLAVNKMIFAAYAALAERDVQVDSITLADELKRRGQFEEVGGLSYMVKLVNATPTALHAMEYAEIIARLYKLRQLTLAARSVVVKVSEWQEADADVLVADCESIILDATSDSESGDGAELVELLTPFYERLEERRKNPGQLLGVSTGLKDLDTVTSGLIDTDLIFVAGRPGMGKSAFAVRLAASACADSRRVLYFSAEMSDDQLLMRFVGMRSGIGLTKIRDGNLTDDEMALVAKSLGEMAEYDIKVYNGMAISQIRSICRREKRMNGDLEIVIDHIGYITTPTQNFGNNRVQELGYISKQLKAMAMELKVPVVVLSQLSRKVEGRGDKRPILSDLRASGTSEEDADVVIFIYRDEYYNPDTTEPKVVEIIVAKQRNGPILTVFAWYDTTTNVWKNLEWRKLEADEGLNF